MTPFIAQRIGTWFSYRASLRNSRHEGSVWHQALKRIREQANSKPRCRSLSQQFAFENPGIIDSTFAKAHSGEDLTRTEKMNYRNELARTLVETTYKHLAGDLERRAKETNEQELREWTFALDEIGEAEDIRS